MENIDKFEAIVHALDIAESESWENHTVAIARAIVAGKIPFVTAEDVTAPPDEPEPAQEPTLSRASIDAWGRLFLARYDRP